MLKTHKFICALAVDWLQRPASRSGPGCIVAVSETPNWINDEIPDAIGWRPYREKRSGSVLVEVKTSRADFLADARKSHRQENVLGMGTYRYFMAPEGLLSLPEIPPKWGFIEVNKRGHIKVRSGHVLLSHHEDDTWRHQSNQSAELCTLAMCLSRVGDPQKYQNRLRDLNNHISRLTRQNEDLRKRNSNLSHELILRTYPDSSLGDKQGQRPAIDKTITSAS